MKFKAKNFNGTNKVLKCAILFISLIIFITAIFTMYNQSVNVEQIVKILLDKINNASPSPVKAVLRHVDEQENIISASSQSDKYKSPGSSFNQNYEDKRENSSETLLYRKRRYLQFPEGSSLQLVFNVLLPIIDYTNYAILGITCALAFELPSKPLSELEDELIQKLHHMGSHHGLLHNDSAHHDTKFIDMHHYQNHIKDTFSNLIHVHPSEYEYKSSYGHKNYYKNYIPGPYSPSYNQRKPVYYTNNNYYNTEYSSKNGKFDAGKPTFESFWKPSYSKSPYIRRQDKIPKRKEHAVYHIMGRRSIQEVKPSTADVEDSSSWLNKLDQIHLQYHRSSRHELYSKLEIMLSRKGKNGTECILRALCETGKRRHESEPGELLTEIFRAVFTLPKDLEMNYKHYHPMHKARDDAHWNQQNCSEAYPLCENFIWDGNFRV